MKKVLLAIPAFLSFCLLQAQQKQGKVVYQRTVQLNIQIQDEAMAQMIPKTRTDNFDLAFGNNQSLWTIQEEEMTPDAGGEGGMRFMMMRGQNDIMFNDFNTTKRIEQREMFEKKYLIEDSIRKLPWKLTDETQTILDHVCRKATSQRVQQSSQMSMENGKMERKQVTDTVPIVAWFTTDIPVSAGPEALQGQLPGLILALDINNGRMVYKATSISDKVDVATIKAPTKGKKVTMDEFRAEQNKMMEEMQKNMQGGGNRVIIRN
jgi:GLPGLI family protein